MKRIKVLALGLILGVAGVVYAAGGNAQPTTAEDSCSMMGCCAGGSCQMGGSCCAAKAK